jgi:membrane-associated phospholipid phosphatase
VIFRAACRRFGAMWRAVCSMLRELSSRAASDTTRVLRVGAVMSAGVLIAVPFGLCVVEVVTHGPLIALDQQVVERLNRYNIGDHDAVDVARFVSALGSTMFLALVATALVVIIGVKQRRRRAAIYLALTSLVGFGLDQGLKSVIGRNRPVLDHAAAHALGHSFPSGHAMNSTIVYGALLIVAWQTLRTWTGRALALVTTTVVITAIAMSRVVLTVHYPSDVIAGIALGAAVVLLGAALLAPRRIDPSSSPHGRGLRTPPVGSRTLIATDSTRQRLPAPQLQIRPTTP